MYGLKICLHTLESNYSKNNTENIFVGDVYTVLRVKKNCLSMRKIARNWTIIKSIYQIPVIIHRVKKWACDAHFIIYKICSKFAKKGDILPLNRKIYICFKKHVKESKVKFSFIDTFIIMASSLEKLASYLDEWRIINFEFSNLTRGKIELLTRKGSLPYDNLGWKKLLENQLPRKEQFYSTLNDSDISNKDDAQ